MCGAIRGLNNKKYKNRTVSSVVNESVGEVVIGDDDIHSIKDNCCSRPFGMAPSLSTASLRQLLRRRKRTK